jgi:hypothetical protein
MRSVMRSIIRDSERRKDTGNLLAVGMRLGRSGPTAIDGRRHELKSASKINPRLRAWQSLRRTAAKAGARW